MAGLVSPADAPDAVTRALRRWAAEPFDRVRDNCGLAVLRYVEEAVARRLFPPPAYTSWLGALRMLKRAGGYALYCDWAMGRLGCPPTLAPRRGDVGLIELSGGLTAAICLGRGMWGARGDRAVVIEAAEAETAWRVPCRRH